MASKDSGELEWGSGYNLGEYSFRVERSAGTSPGYDKIEAICTKGGKNARKSIQIPSSKKIGGWYVEANETEATVYIYTDEYKLISYAFSAAYEAIEVHDVTTDMQVIAVNAVSGQDISHGPYYLNIAFVSHVHQTVHFTGTHSGSITLNDRTGGLYSGWYVAGSSNNSYGLPTYPQGSHDKTIAMYTGGEPEYIEESMMVGRFAIDLGDAGGDGPGSDWTDPGDYDPDWEEGDPTHTLYVEVTGALSGRHNDPIVDPSYSYIPADKDTVKDYGCGGDGGHGGGGGAGASTVVIHKFATNQANSKEVTALARRHGYGSGGGKGGKGGDGCILVYY